MKLLWWVWGLPQNVIGFILMLYFHYHKGYPMYRYKDAWVIEYAQSRAGAVSLGQYIFLWSRYTNKERIIRHEYGHTRQSHLLGPLYFLVIGIPSFVWNIFFQKYRIKNSVSYYDFWVESWADKLGKVDRK